MCVNGFTQNNYESYNQLIWKITQKIVPCRSKVVEIAAYIAAGMFNEGKKSLLYFMSTLEVSLGTAVHAYVDKKDAECMMICDTRPHGSTRERRKNDFTTTPAGLIRSYCSAKGPSYGPGIDNTM
ncbi:uncharacterized protein TNCV_77081 [Trichonephila clavipes]|nr:uncharacterized protein TNCV_77081 [Trichonephila clavipes]